jgi:hypothetical protein
VDYGSLNISGDDMARRSNYFRIVDYGAVVKSLKGLSVNNLRLVTGVRTLSKSEKRKGKTL